MKRNNYVLLILMGYILVSSSCTNTSKQSVNSEDSLEVENQVITSDDSEGSQDRFVPARNIGNDDARRKAERSLAQANLEIEKEHNKIDNLFDKLLEVKSKLTEAKEQAGKFDENTPDYTSAQKKVESSEKALQIILDDVNRQYAKIYGFLLTVSNCEDLAEAVKDKVKSHIAVETLQKYKRKALEEIDNKYIGEP